MATKTIHLIGNAHIDLVWQWDCAEGLNEGLITARAMVNLLDEFPEFSFTRGESSIYEHIERTDPALFERIAGHVRLGRWDVAGGSYVQPDVNMPSTEALVRQFTRGVNYFQSRFGKRVTVAWIPDSFGHPAGLPEILAAAGMTGYAFTRPPHFAKEGAFWWVGPGGSRVLGYRPIIGWYGCERQNIVEILNAALESTKQHPFDNYGVFYGTGNHGGGPTRRHIVEIANWKAAHPEVHVIHSGLHRLFEALNAEAQAKGDGIYPEHTGDMNHVHRGCYSSVAKHKFAYRKLEAAVSRAERTSAIIDASSGDCYARPNELIASAWDAALFNAFHDVLPGTSLERAFDQQIDWMGGAIYETQQVNLQSMNKLASMVDTRVKPVEGDLPTGLALLVWNPHPFAVSTPVELEASLDYRPIWAYANRHDELPYELIGPDGTPVIAQKIQQESFPVCNSPWRLRVVTSADVPALGWAVYELAYREGAAAPAKPECLPSASIAPGEIDNGIYRVKASAGSAGIAIWREGKPVLSGDGLGAIMVNDPHGSWGGPESDENCHDMNDIKEVWKIARVETLEKGPVRSALWVRLTGGHSTLDLTISLVAGRDAVDVSARLLLNERALRVKLVMPLEGSVDAVYDTPGALVTRGDDGETPGGRWVRVNREGSAFGFASDALYGFNFKPGVLQATIARASRYAADASVEPEEDIWNPAVDRGELKFRFLISPGDDNLSNLAKLLEEPMLVQTVLPTDGKLGRTGSFGRIEPADLTLLALKPAQDSRGLVLRVQNLSGVAKDAVFVIGRAAVALGEVAPGRIAGWRLTPSASGWQSEPADGIA